MMNVRRSMANVGRGISPSILFLLLYTMLATAITLFIGLDAVSTGVLSGCFMIGILIYYIKRRSPVGIVGQHIDLTMGFTFFGMFLLLWLYGQITANLILTTIGDPSFGQYQEAMTASPFMVLLLTLIVAPIMEELLCRGVMYGDMRRHIGPWQALIIQAFIFAIMHGTRVHLFGTFALGILTGILYEMTGSLRVPIFAHMGYNMITLLNTSFSIPDVLLSPLVVIIVDVVIIGIFFLIYEQVLSRRTTIKS